MKFYRLSGATFYDSINTIFKFIEPFLDNKMSIFEEYGAFNGKKFAPIGANSFLDEEPHWNRDSYPWEADLFLLQWSPFKTGK